MNDTIESLRARLQQLKALRDAGSLATPAYEDARAPLERQLVDLVTNAAPAQAPRPSALLVASLAAGVLAIAVAGYSLTGAPALIRGVATAAAPASGAAAADAQTPTPAQISEMVDKLALRLKDRPDDVQGWTMLARAYLVLGRGAEAVPAYAKAVALKPDDAGLLVDYADALAMQNGRQLDGEPMKLIERALRAEPGNPKALALAGTAAFDRKDYALAVKHWEQLMQAVPADSAYRTQVQAGIDEARQLGKLPPPTHAATAVAAAGGRVSGTVTLAAALAAQASPGDTVFVFARAADGPRMPLAVLRKQVKDLPFEFSLDDSMAMSPAAKLSGASSVVVGARISKSGEAIPQDGDLTGQAPPVAPGASGLKIEISEVVRK